MKYYLFILLITICSCSCSKNSSGPLPPSNLQLTANVKADNSGTVDFVAKADNATSYDFDFGNGIHQTSSNGILSYTYPASGSYTVKVTAKNSQDAKITVSKEITVTRTLSMVWSDEFDGNGAPNPAKWVYDIGTGSNGWGNNEVQYYTNSLENAFVSNGTLKIIAKKQEMSGSQYTSARLKTQGKFDFKYGKVEIRAKLPSGVHGIWPAAWMLGSNITSVGWPASGEIDIMEYLTRDPEYVYGTFHYPERHGGNANGNKIKIINPASEFHVFSLEWSPEVLKIFIDGQLIHSLANSSTLPFNNNFFIILNLALGGNFGGTLDPAFTSAQMEVDYVRVYQ